MFGMTVKPESGGLFNESRFSTAVANAEVKNIEKSAAYVRTVAANSLKPGRQKKLADLTAQERQNFRIRQALFAAGKIDKKPKRPTEPSKPGEPPRLQRPTRYLKVKLRFAFDPTTRTYVVGPERIARKGLAPAALEKGDASLHLQPRPFMVPALDKERAKLAKRWENSITQ